MARIRTPGVGGLVEDNPLASGATTMTSAGLAALPLFGANDFALVTFDPEGRTGAPFSKRMTAHAAAATTATIDAAAIDGVARSIDQDVMWRITNILDQDGNGSGLIGYTEYQPAADYTTSSTSPVDVDATNLKVDFTVPPSGRVMLRLAAVLYMGGAGNAFWGLREGAADIVTRRFITNGAVAAVQSRTMLVTGLTPGQAKTYKWSYCVSASSQTMYANAGSNDPFTMEVWAVNV